MVSNSPGGPPQKVTIGLVQMRIGDCPEKNLYAAAAAVERAAGSGAQIICLPELFQFRYFCQREDAGFFELAEPVPGPTTRAIGETAKKCGVVVVVPLFERRAAGIYHNSLAVINTRGDIAGFYRKMHIPDDPSYYEKFYFTPGDLGFQAFATEFACVGTLICWDQWYPEAARLAALKGAEILVCPTAIGWHPHEKETCGAAQHDSWRTIQRGHAIANGIFVAAVNRVGYEPCSEPGGGRGIEFWGASFVADPQGAVVAEASARDEEILLAEIDRGRIEHIRRNWPFLRDRRIDAYAGLNKRYL